MAMMLAKDRQQWNHTAAMMATVINVNRPKNKKAISANDVNPYANTNSSNKIKLTRDSLHMLRHMTGVTTSGKVE